MIIFLNAVHMNVVIAFFYRLYSMLPFVTPILTMSQLCESKEQISPPLYCRYVFINGILPVQAEIVHEEPYVILYHRLITEFDSNRVIKLMEPYRKQALIGGITDKGSRDFKIRNSTTGGLPEPSYTRCIVKRWFPIIQALSGLNVMAPSAETMALTHYEKGGFYYAHLDSDMTEMPHARRLATFLLYLNGDYQGGNTIFPHLQLAITPKQGDGLVFYSHKTDTEMDEDMVHMGCPLTDGEKWIGSLWIRNNTQNGPAATCFDNELYAKPGFLRSSF